MIQKDAIAPRLAGTSKNHLFGGLKALFWLVAFCCMPLVSWAETGYSLEACFKAALKRSEIMADQEEQIIQAEEHYRQALGSILPAVSAQGLYGQEASGGPGNTTPTEQHFARLTATQPLFRGFREYAALSQTKTLIQYQRLAQEWAGLQLYQDVSQAFFNALAWQKDLMDLDGQIDLYSRRIRDLQARVAIGRSRSSEVLSVQSAQALLRAQRQQTVGQEEVAREILAFLTGLAPDMLLQEQPAFAPTAQPLDAYLKLLDTRPDVLAAQNRVEAGKKNIEIAQGAHWPSLDVSGDYYLDRSAPNQNINWDAQITATLPVFMGGVLVSKTREAESQSRQNELALARLRRSAAEDIRIAHHALESDLLQHQALTEALQLAKQNQQAILRDYNYGLVTNLDVLQAMSSYQDTQRTVDRMRYQIQNDFEQLESLAAKRLNVLRGN